GKAYGYWKKQRDKIDPKHVTNDDVRYWVNLRTLNQYSGDAPMRVVMLRENGEDFPQIAGGRYRMKNKGKQPEMLESGFGYSKGNGKAKGHSKDHD
ncbi:MAG TPA: hypothetical protein VFG76_11270, partial [Candidatus Polarisedimenticolia bacterium]|nr:hypothetical protein [Candidatus Polarisedimenticolia bacterium]